MSTPFSDLPIYDASFLIDTLWKRWLDSLERYDGPGAASNGMATQLEAGLRLEAAALLLAAIPAPTWEALRYKTLIAAWLRDGGTGASTWTALMVETVVERDHLALQRDPTP